MARKKSAVEDKKAKKSVLSKYDELFPVRVYRMLRAGLPETEVCKELKVSRQTYYGWLKTVPAMRYAADTAKKENAEADSLPAWIYSRLSEELRAVWDRIIMLEEEPDGQARIEMLLRDHGLRARQQIFLHALCCYQFSPSHALQKANIPRSELQRWVRDDQEFARLYQEIDWHKRNYFEGKLVQLVQEGNPTAVIFANKTLNRDRGYAQKTEVEISGTLRHEVLDLAELMPYLSEKTRLDLLEAIRRKEEAETDQNRRLSPVETLQHRIAARAREEMEEDDEAV